MSEIAFPWLHKFAEQGPTIGKFQWIATCCPVPERRTFLGFDSITNKCSRFTIRLLERVEKSKSADSLNKIQNK